MEVGLFALKLVHVACASIWFGASLLAGADIRRTVDRGRPHVDVLPERIGRLERLAISTGLATFVTGLAVAAWVYGLTRLPVRLYVVIGLALATMFVGALVASPAWQRVRQAIDRDDLEAAREHARRFDHAMWCEHTLRLLTLVFVLGRDVPH